MPTRSFDKDPLYQGLLLSLPMMEGTGTAVTADVAKPHHLVTLTHAPTWTQLASGLWMMDFNSAHPDYLSCLAASCTDLDFTTGFFSLCVWVYPTSVTNKTILWRKGAIAGSGWGIFLTATETRYYTNDVYTAGPPLPLNTWSLLGYARTGALTGLAYYNGPDATTSSSAKNITSTANNLTVATFSDGITYPFNGRLWNPRIWGRVLSPNEHMSIWKRERHLFGV